MSIADLAFLLFAGVTIASGFMVIAGKNPVHSVLFLILSFISTAGLFVLMGAEFLAMVLVIVYVGAVAVLFMFVVMMLDVDFAELKQGMLRYLPFGATVALIVVVELIFVVGVWVSPDIATNLRASPTPPETQVQNVEALGLVLYTDYVAYFQIAGMVLLVAMIGAIVLTFRERANLKRQDAASQINRKREDSVEIVKVPSGGGI